MLIIDAETGNFDEVNNAAAKYYGYSKDQLLKMNISQISISNPEKVFNEMENAALGDGDNFYDKHILSNGQVRNVEVFADTLNIKNKELMFSVVYDTTDYLIKESQIEMLTSRDTLTGLYNRNHFLELLNYEILRYTNTEKEDTRFLIAALSVNEYDEVNDALGHEIADSILKEFSSRLNSIMRPQDYISRYSEGMFLILITRVLDPNSVMKMIRTTLRTINTNFTIENYDINITTNIGIAVFPDDGQDSVTLVRNADIALNQSKKLGNNRIFLFNKDLEKETQEYFWMKNDLFRAIELDELILNYQPIYDTLSKKLVGTEALLRWNHRHKGIIPPLKFIPISEKTGMIYPIGEWVLLTACKQNKMWQDWGYEPIYISVNVSVLQLERYNFFDRVKEILEITKMEPKYLQIEITETYFTENYELISTTMKKLSELGIKFAIDDFGTGYSSLGQLSELNINTLKIDRIFVDRVDSNINNSKIVKAVISLAKSLNIGLTAEGVERMEEFDFLKENQCNSVQGYLFSKPLEAKLIRDYLSS